MRRSYHTDPSNLTWSDMNDQLDILAVVEDHLPLGHLKKKGISHVGLCPFHNERSPSFNVTPSKGIYKCFGCGKGGNAVNFIWETLTAKGYSGKEIAEYIKDKYKLV